MTDDTTTVDDEIIIPKWVFFLLFPLILFLIIGPLVSPIDTEGNPIILSPGVKAIEDYRDSFADWHDEYIEIDRKSQMLLSGSGADLFTVSQDAQGILVNTVQLIQAVEREKTPPAAIPARDILGRVGEGYFTSSQAILEWVAAPTEANHQYAVIALEAARGTMVEMESSQWLTR